MPGVNELAKQKSSPFRGPSIIVVGQEPHFSLIRTEDSYDFASILIPHYTWPLGEKIYWNIFLYGCEPVTDTPG